MTAIAKLSDHVSVAPQLKADDFREIAQLGFKSVINNRPDGEQWRELPHDEAEQLARSNGLEYRFQPVVSGGLTADDIKEFADLVAELPGPVLAYCRSGTRCSMLWALSQPTTVSSDEILSAGAAAGYDLSGLKAHLDTQRES